MTFSTANSSFTKAGIRHVEQTAKKHEQHLSARGLMSLAKMLLSEGIDLVLACSTGRANLLQSLIGSDLPLHSSKPRLHWLNGNRKSHEHGQSPESEQKAQLATCSRMALQERLSFWGLVLGKPPAHICPHVLGIAGTSGSTAMERWPKILEFC